MGLLAAGWVCGFGGRACGECRLLFMLPGEGFGSALISSQASEQTR
jgi:hypothetical protein